MNKILYIFHLKINFRTSKDNIAQGKKINIPNQILFQVIGTITKFIKKLIK